MGKIARFMSVAGCLALLASPATAQDEPGAYDFVPLHELKADSDGLVQEALGVLPNSSLNGTFNRISALNARKPIRDLIAELGGADATSEDLPDSYEKGMEAALLDLQDDLAAADEAFATGEADCVVEADAANLNGAMDCREAKFVILQLLKSVVVNGDAELAPNETNTVCYDSLGRRCDTTGDRPVDDVTIQVFGYGWDHDVNDWIQDRDKTRPVDRADDEVRAVDLQGTVNDQVERVSGVPIIDWGIVHGEPIIDL